jgi:hypothetical protein
MVFAMVVAIFAFSANPALATVPSEFGAKGAGAGQLEEPKGVAVFQETGDVYVVDTTNERVDSFTAEGVFRFAVGWGVLDGKSELEVCSTTCHAGLPGAGAGQFRGPGGIAVDNDPASQSYGDFYVVDSENHRVQKFDRSGHFLLAFGKGVNLSTKEDVCTAAEANNCGEGQFGFGPGEFSITFGGIAVGPTGIVYVGDFGRVEEFGPDGKFASEFPLGGEASVVPSLVVNENSEVYVLFVAGEGISGVHRYDQFGSELGAAFDTAGSPEELTLGPAGDLIVAEHTEGNPSGQPNLVEFDPTGIELKSFDIGTKSTSRGVAFGGSLARVYVLNKEQVRLVEVPPAGPFTGLASEAAIDAKPSHVVVEAVLDAEGSPTKYHFEYGETTGYGSQTAPASLSEEKGLFAAVPVTADLTGLKPNTVYHFRTVTEDTNGHTTFGPDATVTTSPPVLIAGESATQVTPESARLNVEINPQGAATSYRYEYGPTEAYGQSVPTPDAEAGDEEVSAAHSITLEHLTASTVYHYRVVASNVFGAVQGPDRVFTTPAANGGTMLADGRVWEMVSPPQKHGASLESISEEGGLIKSSENGDALVYFGTGPLGSEAEPEGSQNISDSQFVAKRSAPGVWETKDITTPHDQPVGFHPGKRSEYFFFSPDLSEAFVEPFGATPLAPEATQRTPYLRRANGAFVPLVTPANVLPGLKYEGEVIGEGGTGGGDYLGAVELVGAAPNMSSALFTSPLALTNELAPPEGSETRSLYRWDTATHGIELVSWLPAPGGGGEVPAAAIGDKASLGNSNDVTRDAVSTNGEDVIYETQDSSNGTGTHLYLRDLALKKSVQLDLLENGESGGGEAHFQDASANGKVIYFTDEEHLTANATGSRSENHADLFRCEVEDVKSELRCSPKDISVPIVAGEAGDVLGNIVGTDESGDRVYFTADGKLTANATASSCRSGISSACNLYVYDATTEETRLIAVLSGRDAPDWGYKDVSDLQWLTSRVSPNGRYLAFMSERELTGYDNRDAISGVPDEEVFRYDFDRSQLTCVSCDPTGARPNGVLDNDFFPGLLVDRTGNWKNQWVAALIPGWTNVSKVGPPVRAPYQSRYLTNDGRVFFDSVDSLVPADVNGQFDVYEYEPSGVGSCGLEAGCVALMSSGLDGGESAFLDSGAEGNDVFFMTSAQLSRQDTDSLRDVYDARVCSGSDCPVEGSGAPPPCETSDACRAAPASQPDIYGAPSSSTFSGAGNLTPPSGVAVVKAKPLTRARLLANALNACHKDRTKKRRVSCERKARKRYGPPRQARKAGHTTTTREGGK